MIRAIVLFAVAIAVIAEVRAQDGDDGNNQCGMMMRQCNSNQCCVMNMYCANIPGENGMCLTNGFGCDCPDGYECRATWGMMGTCQLSSSESRQGIPIPTGFPTGFPFP